MRRTTRTRTSALLTSGLVVALAAGIAPNGIAFAAPSSPAAASQATATPSPSGESIPASPSSDTADPSADTTDSDADAPGADQAVDTAASAAEPSDVSSESVEDVGPDAAAADVSSSGSTRAGASAQRFTMRDGVRVYDTGSMAITPKFTMDANGKPTSAQLGLVDKTDSGTSADEWTSPSVAVVHIRKDAQGKYSLPAADAELTGEQTVYGTDQTAAEYAQQGGLLFGFDTRSQAGQLNGDVSSSVKFGSAYQLEGLNGTGWSVHWPDVNWDEDPPTRTTTPLWTPAEHSADFQSAPGQYGRAAGWNFTASGTYCVTVANRPLSTKEPKGSPATDLSTHATFTVIVGALPTTVTTCPQPSDSGGGEKTNLVQEGHHDLRTYLGSDGEIHWGLDSKLWTLDDVVIGRTPPPATVQPATGSTDMRVVGPVGTKYWYFPQTSTENAGDYVWPGWSTESMDRTLIDSKVGISLDGFTRDGAVDPTSKVMLLGSTSGGTNSVYFDSTKGITSFEEAGNNHSHNIWVFTKPGQYCVAMTATVHTAAGRWTSATQNVAFAVGDDVDLQSAQPCGSSTVPALSSALPTVGAKSTVTRLQQGGAQIDLAVKEGVVRSVATSGVRQTDEKLVRDPDDLIVHGAEYDGRTGQWRGHPGSAGAVALRTDGLDPAAILDRHVTLGFGTVDGPGTVTAISADSTKTYGAVSSVIGGSRSMNVPVRSTTRELQWFFSKPGVYCVPVTYSATLTSGKAVTGGNTLTFAVGPNADGTGIDLSKYTTCSRGQEGVDLSKTGDGDGGGTGPSHADVYLENGTKNRAGATVLNDGHVDVASRLQAGKLDTVVKDTTESATPTWRDLRKTVLQLLPESKTTVASGYDFLGKPGSAIWQVDQTQQQNLLWPGWSTESLPDTATKGGVTWALNDVQPYPDQNGNSPMVGNFALYEQTGFGEPDVLLSSTGKRSFLIGKNVHAHGTWAFSKEGVYCMAMTRSAIAADGSDLQHDFVMAIAVGNVSVQDIDPTKCFSGKIPTGTAAGTIVGGDTDATDDDGVAAATPSLANMVQKVCTAPSTTGGSAAATAATTVISRGHVDVGSRLVDGKLRTLVKDGSQGGATWREPGATTIWLKPAAKVSSPGGAFSFLGAGGSTAWQIPQTQNPDLVWLGWNTEEITAAQVNGPVQWTLNSVDGPGQVTVYELASFGSPEKILTAGGSYSIPLGTHAHGNWGFTAEGTYRLHMTQTVQLAGGGTSTDRQTLTIVVGGTSPAATTTTAPAKTTKATDALECATPFGSTVPAVSAADEPEAAQGGGTSAGGIRPVAQAAPSSGAVPGSPTWMLAVIGFGGVLGAGGAGSLATWLLTRRRGLGG